MNKKTTETLHLQAIQAKKNEQRSVFDLILYRGKLTPMACH